MARREDLAGLAALGALGYALTQGGRKAPVEDRIGTPVNRNIPTADTRDFGVDYTESPNRGGDFMSDKEPGWESSVAPARGGAGTVAPVRQAPVSRPPVRPSASDDDLQRIQNRYATAIANRRPTEAPLENVYPEANLVAPGLKTLSAAAKSLAGRAAPLREYIQPTIGYTERKLLQGPAKQLTGPSKAELLARDRAARSAAREAEKEEFNRRGVDRFIESTSEGGMKRGGKVKAKAKPKKMASGGSTSSASKRADGIATKGKTKCKMY